MTFAIQQLFTPVQLTGAAAVLLTMPTSPPSTVLMNGRVRLTNTSASPVVATLYADVAAAASGVANECFVGSLAASSFVDVDIPVLKVGDTLRGFAGTAAVITVHSLGGTLYSA